MIALTGITIGGLLSAFEDPFILIGTSTRNSFQMLVTPTPGSKSKPDFDQNMMVALYPDSSPCQQVGRGLGTRLMFVIIQVVLHT